MHIPDGILPLPVTLGGYAVCLAAVGGCLYRISRRPDPQADIPKASLFTAAFFVASLIHLPVPPLSVHLVLSGLLGVVLGFFALPAILIGLFFQAVVFGHGGLTTLGINGVIIGLPALVAYGLFLPGRPGSPGRPDRPGRAGTVSRQRTAVFAFLAGSSAIMLSVLLFAVIILTTMPAHLETTTERTAIGLLVAGHLPLALIEGLLTAMIVLFLRRVSPRILQGV